MARKDEAPELSIRNRKAWHLYEITEKLEAGIQLVGTEVKSVRAHSVDFTDAYVSITKSFEAYVESLHIAPWPQAGVVANHEPKRRRKLLLKRSEIVRLHEKIKTAGLTVVPLSIYGKGRWIKVEIGLARGKKLHDKRESLKEKQSKREVAREMKERHR